MGTTTDRAAGGRDLLVQALNEILLGSRDSLPRGLNGRGPAPSDPKAAQLRKDMVQGRVNPIGQLLTILECDVRDHVVFSEIVAPLRQMIEHLEVLAVSGMLRPERPIMTLMRAETKAQARADLAQLKLAESPACVDALADAIREVDAHAQALNAFKVACERKLAVVRNAPRERHLAVI